MVKVHDGANYLGRWLAQWLLWGNEAEQEQQAALAEKRKSLR